MSGPARPSWRSLLYVPAHLEKFVASAHTRGADAIILDLEDSVPPEWKAAARDGLSAAARQVGQAGADVVVRVNSEPELAAPDIAAAVGAGAIALSLPKVDGPEDVVRIAGLVSRAEAEHGLPEGRTGLILLIESAAGFLAMAASAKASPRVLAIALGAEDFALDLGVEPTDDILLAPRQQLVIAAAAAGVAPLGVVGMATRFDEPDAYLDLARRSRRFGFVGASCIHPKQVPLLNAAFSPSEAEVDQARRVIEALEAAAREGRGAAALQGRMIDAPTAERARRLIARADAIRRREGGA
jgi:citrate lyase subunit beta/citryl-CoA lyase